MWYTLFITQLIRFSRSIIACSSCGIYVSFNRNMLRIKRCPGCQMPWTDSIFPTFSFIFKKSTTQFSRRARWEVFWNFFLLVVKSRYCIDSVPNQLFLFSQQTDDKCCVTLCLFVRVPLEVVLPKPRSPLPTHVWWQSGRISLQLKLEGLPQLETSRL